MLVLRSVIVLLGVGFAAMVVWAFNAANFGQSFGAMIADPWGIVSLADLYLGFFLFGVFVWFFESTRGVAIAVISLTPFLGNVIPALWLAWRLRSIVQRSEWSSER